MDPVTHDIVAAEVSLENVHDVEVLPTLLNPLRRKLGRVYYFLLLFFSGFFACECMNIAQEASGSLV